VASVASLLAAVACFAGTHGSSQLVTVQAPPHATIGALSLWARQGRCWRRVAGPWTARLGRSGVSAHKREGDGATPRGRMQLEYGFFRGDRIALPSSRLRLVRIASDMGWCDSPSHPCYNRPVRLPFAASHERLMREDGLYDVCLVMEWNRRHRRRNAGSAIFFHVARPDFAPTEGCVAVSLPAMRQLLALAGPKTHVVVA